MRKPPGMMAILCIFIVVLVVFQLYTFSRTYRTMHFKWVNYMSSIIVKAVKNNWQKNLNF